MPSMCALQRQGKLKLTGNDTKPPSEWYLGFLVNVDSVHGMLHQLEVCGVVGAGNCGAAGSVQVPEVL